MKVIAVTSGKGGVGKTLTSIQLAICSQRLGNKTILVDGDFGLANVDVVLGLDAKYNISSTLNGNIGLEQTLLKGPLGLDILPSGSGLSELANLSYVERIKIFDELMDLKNKYDVCIIDTGAGISHTVLHQNKISDHVVLVTTPDPHAITDAYAMIKVVDHPQINVITNMVCGDEEGSRVFSRLKSVSQKYLGKSIKHIGSVPADKQIQKLVLNRNLGNALNTIAGQRWNVISTEILEDCIGNRKQERVWNDLLGEHSNHHGMQEVI